MYAEIDVKCLLCGLVYPVGVICDEPSQMECPNCGPGNPVVVVSQARIDMEAPKERNDG